MCKPSCCPGDNGGGPGIAVAGLIGVGLVVAEARPIVHAAEDLLRIVAITASALAGVTILTAATILIIRSRTTRTPALPLPRTHLVATGRTTGRLPDTGPSRAELARRPQDAEEIAHAALAAAARARGAVRLSDQGNHPSRPGETYLPE